MKPSLTLLDTLGVGRHNEQCPYHQHTSAHCAQSVTRSTTTPVSPTSASSSSPSKPGQASRVENDQCFCAICADGLLWRERSTTLSCGHIFHPSCVDDLARYLRRRLFGGIITINCLLCRRPISISSISSFEHVRVIPTCASFIFRRVRTTPSNSTSMAVFGYFTALVEDIAQRRLPRYLTPPGWRSFVREYRRRVLVHPVLPGVPTLVNTVFYTYSPHKQQRSWSEILHWRVCCQAIRPLLFHGLLFLRILTTALELTL